MQGRTLFPSPLTIFPEQGLAHCGPSINMSNIGEWGRRGGKTALPGNSEQLHGLIPESPTGQRGRSGGQKANTPLRAPCPRLSRGSGAMGAGPGTGGWTRPPGLATGVLLSLGKGELAGVFYHLREAWVDAELQTEGSWAHREGVKSRFSPLQGPDTVHIESLAGRNGGRAACTYTPTESGTTAFLFPGELK